MFKELRNDNDSAYLVCRYVSGFRPTHNGDGRYLLVWRLWSDGVVDRTNGRSTFRRARFTEVLPKAITAAAEEQHIRLENAHVRLE